MVLLESLNNNNIPVNLQLRVFPFTSAFSDPVINFHFLFCVVHLFKNLIQMERSLT